VSVLSTNEVRSPTPNHPRNPTNGALEIEKNSKCLINMPTEYTCTVTPPLHALKHAKSHYSLSPARGSPSPTKSRTRPGTPVGRPGSAAGDEKTFTFDHCLWSVDDKDGDYAGQERLYEVLGEEFLRHSLEGYNCCIFACNTPFPHPRPSYFWGS
jgi:hypothetical protein